MIDRCEQARLALEAGHSTGVAGKGRRQDLDRDFAPQSSVSRPIDLSHPAGAQRPEDLEDTEPNARLE